MRGGDGLFEVEPVEPKRPQARPAVVDKRFRAFDPNQVLLLLPPSLDDWLPEDHLARFVAELVDEVLDLSPILADYTEKRGYPPYDPRLMVRRPGVGREHPAEPHARSRRSPKPSRSAADPATSFQPPPPGDREPPPRPRSPDRSPVTETRS